MSRISLPATPGRAPLVRCPMPRLGHCFCGAFVPPGRACCWTHAARFDADEVTPVAPIKFR